MKMVAVAPEDAVADSHELETLSDGLRVRDPLFPLESTWLCRTDISDARDNGLADTRGRRTLPDESRVRAVLFPAETV